jgi:hypothetical protein
MEGQVPERGFQGAARRLLEVQPKALISTPALRGCG